MVEVVIGKAIEQKPEFVFCQLQSPEVPKELLAQLPGFKVNWSGDVREPLPSWYGDYADVFDWTALVSEDQVNELLRQGKRARWLNIGFDDAIFSPTGSVCRDVPPIVFMGNDYGDTFPLGALRRNAIAALQRKFGTQVGVYGRFPGATSSLMWDEPAEAAHYRGCLLAIGMSHYRQTRYSSDRQLRAMGCGACYLTLRYPGMEKDFKEGEHLFGWDTITELLDLVETLLHKPDVARLVGAQGCALVHQRHTWQERIKEMVTWMAEKRK
jgi:hypothetical protein